MVGNFSYLIFASMVICLALAIYMLVLVYMFGFRRCTSWQFEVQINKPRNVYYRLGVSYLPVDAETECLSVGLLLVTVNLYFYFDDFTAEPTNTNI